MAAFMQQANAQLDAAGGFALKAVFVTFNEQAQAAACLAACPRRWLGSWLQPRRARFLGEYRFWVEPAKPPEVRACAAGPRPRPQLLPAAGLTAPLLLARAL